MRAVQGAAPVLRPQQRGVRRPAGHPARRRRALRAPRRPADPARRAGAVQVRLDDAARLPTRQLAGSLLALAPAIRRKGASQKYKLKCKPSMMLISLFGFGRGGFPSEVEN